MFFLIQCKCDVLALVYVNTEFLALNFIVIFVSGMCFKVAQKGF